MNVAKKFLHPWLTSRIISAFHLRSLENVTSIAPETQHNFRATLHPGARARLREDSWKRWQSTEPSIMVSIVCFAGMSESGSLASYPMVVDVVQSSSS
jgi:hypothetical protein